MLESFAGCSPRWPTPMSRASISSSSLTLPYRVLIYIAHAFLPLHQLWDTLRIFRHQNDSKTRYARPPSATSIMEIYSGRRLPSLRSA